MTIKLNSAQKSALIEAGNIGAGHAAISLAQIMGKKIMIGVPSIEVVELKDLGNVIGRDSSSVFVHLKVSEGMDGLIVFAMSEEKARLLTDIIMDLKKGTTRFISDMEISAFKEVAHIICASYVNALSEIVGTSIMISVPELVMAESSQISKLLEDKKNLSKRPKEVLCIKTYFIDASTTVEGHIIFTGFESLLEKITQKMSNGCSKK